MIDVPILLLIVVVGLVVFFCIAEHLQDTRHAQQMDKLRRIETLIRCKIGLDNPEDLAIFDAAEKESQENQ